MSQNFKWVNLNPFPVYLPCDRGGQVMFRPGEGTSKQWYSRFTSRGQLTRTIIDKDGKVRPVPASKHVPPVVSAAAPIKDVKVDATLSTGVPARDDKRTFKDEDFDDYSVTNGVYRCKLCDKFMTGSSKSMEAHIADFHGKNSDVKQNTADGSVTITSRQSASQFIPNEAEVPETEAPANPNPNSTETKSPDAPPDDTPEVFRCAHPGCGKEFASNRGLSMHNRRVHG